MKESVEIAYTVVRSWFGENDKHYLENHEVHVHFPEGASKKDGPSAGCAIATAMTSLVLNKPLYKDIAMTGELSLTGKVLPVGGLFLIKVLKKNYWLQKEQMSNKSSSLLITKKTLMIWI